DREKYLGDMDFVRIPYDGLLSKDYARERRALIDPQKASLDMRPGTAERFMKSSEPLRRPVHINLDGDADHEGDTSYIGIVDAKRNMVSFTPSLHSAFGSGIVIGDLGLIFNCRGDYYSLVPGEANALEPGKRPRSTLQATLVTKDGQPFMATGSPGGADQAHDPSRDARGRAGDKRGLRGVHRLALRAAAADDRAGHRRRGVRLWRVCHRSRELRRRPAILS